MIEIRGLSFRYAGKSRDALHNIDMTVEDGDFIGAKMGKVDGKRLKANVYYTLCNGKFVKAEED